MLRKILALILDLVDSIFGRVTFGVWVKSEEFRNASSKLTKESRGVDSRLIYSHEVSDYSYAQFYKSLDLLDQEVARAFRVNIKFFGWARKKRRSRKLEINWHPMGTLPFGENSFGNVCDENLSLHGAKNVFLLTAAVFNRGSNGNPTFTTLALASRLARETFSRQER
jgi:choline dehydrogenase-like flavoprotein